jgi:hypothetical protein
MISPRNIIVLFAPGLGGNHLANIISTDSRFQPRTSVKTYQENTTSNAHFYNIQNLDLTALPDIDCDKNHVLCGHWGEYYWAKIHNHLTRLPNRQLIIIKVPVIGSLAYDRMLKYTRLTVNQYLVEEQRSLYSMDVIEKCMQEHDLVEVTTELMFCENIDSILAFLSDQMDLNLDPLVCKAMHKVWFEKINKPLTICSNNHTTQLSSVII